MFGPRCGRSEDGGHPTGDNCCRELEQGPYQWRGNVANIPGAEETVGRGYVIAYR